MGGPLPVEIEQGPAWLVELYLDPPWWVNPSLQFLGLVVAGVVAYRLYQRGYRISSGEQRAMLQIAGTVVGVMVGVLGMANFTEQPYLVDVGVGLVVGYVVVFALANVEIAWPLPVEKRLSYGWGALAVLGLVGPQLANVNGQGMLPGSAQLYVVLLGCVMLAYNEYLVDEVLDSG